jgi:hypothetical protein
MGGASRPIFKIKKYEYSKFSQSKEKFCGTVPKYAEKNTGE